MVVVAVMLTDATEELDAKSSKDVEEQEEEKTKVSDLWQRLHHRVE